MLLNVASEDEYTRKRGKRERDREGGNQNGYVIKADAIGVFSVLGLCLISLTYSGDTSA